MQPYSAGTAAPFATSPTKDHAKNAIKITAVMHIIGGSVITALGCVAIGLKSYKSYIAAPLWTGLGVFLLTGLFGLFTHRGSVPRTCLISAYLGMSIASITCGFGIFVLNIVAAAHEELFGCVPFHYSWFCPTDDWVRVLVDCVLVVSGAFEIAVGITSTVAASYKLSCCRNSCCGGNNIGQQTPQPVQMSLLPGYVQSPPAYATGQPVGGQFYILPANAIAHSQVMGNQAQQGMGPVVHSQAQPVAPVQLAQYNPDIAAPEPTSGSTEKEA